MVHRVGSSAWYFRLIDRLHGVWLRRGTSRRPLAGTGASVFSVVDEMNTRVPLHPEILAWWRQEGGQGNTFASDAHEPDALARGFREAARFANTAGFSEGGDPLDFWPLDFWRCV